MTNENHQLYCYPYARMRIVLKLARKKGLNIIQKKNAWALFTI